MLKLQNTINKKFNYQHNNTKISLVFVCFGDSEQGKTYLYSLPIFSRTTLRINICAFENYQLDCKISKNLVTEYKM